MRTDIIEIYHERSVSQLGDFRTPELAMKLYGLQAHGQEISDMMCEKAKTFISTEVVQRADKMGDSNGLGFAIIHPGDLGLSISAHWWAQGSVLCQHTYRKQYKDEMPLDTVQRPVVGCVWELTIIDAERRFWSEMMMSDTPDPDAYLATRFIVETV